MTIEEMTIEQVKAGIAHIEAYYRQHNGTIDLFLMSEKDPHLYSTWRKLRDRVREYERSIKDAGRTTDRR